MRDGRDGRRRRARWGCHQSAFSTKIAGPVNRNDVHPMKTPVLIVGGGPVGLAMAGDLGWRGIPCVLMEKTDGGIAQPRMDMVGVRTMEFCRRWGIVPWVEAAGYNRDYPQDNAWVTSLVGGYELGREPFPSPRDEQPPPESPQKRERCPQNFFDPVLARFAGSFPQVTLRYRTELLDFTEHADGVTARVIDHATGDDANHRGGLFGRLRRRRRHDPRAARHRAYRQSGADVYDQRDLPPHRLGAVAHAAPRLPVHLHRPRGHLRHHRGDRRPRSLALLPRRQPRDRKYSEADLRAAIARAVGRDFDCEIVSMLPWTRRELLAERYGTGRVFSSATAAHQLSPTGGFGMNTGIQEAVDLAWKLEARLRGWGGDKSARLLRGRAAAGGGIRNIREAGGNLARMLSPRDACRRRKSSPRAGRATRRARSSGREIHRDDAARMVHPRHPPRLSLRGFADLHP